MTYSSGSILARLKNKAKEEGIAFQQLLNLFFQEELGSIDKKNKNSEMHLNTRTDMMKNPSVPVSVPVT